MARSFLDYNGLLYFYGKIDSRINERLFVVAKTRTQWASSITEVSKKNVLYVYTDYRIITKPNGDEIVIPGLKFGDGATYVVDLPFIAMDDELLLNHVNNTDIHITAAERVFWNNKNRTYIDDVDNEMLVITKL